MPSKMRVSDTERQRTVDELRRHCTAGRIDMDEYSRRIEKAMGAERLEELDAVLADLPILRIADPSAPGETRQRQRRARNNGHHHFRPFAQIPALGPAGSSLGADAAFRTARIASTLTAFVAVAVVVTAVILVVAVSWTWAAVLIAGWVAGMVQAAAAKRRSSRSG
jgi:Domain of unknown function (DUF1707)